MKRLLLAGLLLVANTAHAETPARWVVSVDGMSCSSCSEKVGSALSTLPEVDRAHASFLEKAACIEGSSLSESAVKSAVEGAGFVFGGVEAVDRCPQGLRGTLPAPWDDRSAGLDVVTISHGEQVDPVEHLAANKYTIVDFGAPWCAPCHEAAERLAGYLRAHEDVAVRVVDLVGETVEASYALPVVAQHLQYVDGIPWFVVYRPDGKVLMRDRKLDRVFAAIDKHRAKQARRKR